MKQLIVLFILTAIAFAIKREWKIRTDINVKWDSNCSFHHNDLDPVEAVHSSDECIRACHKRNGCVFFSWTASYDGHKSICKMKTTKINPYHNRHESICGGWFNINAIPPA